MQTGKKNYIGEPAIGFFQYRVIRLWHDYDAIKTALSAMDKNMVDVAFRQAIKTKQLVDFKGWLETLPANTT